MVFPYMQLQTALGPPAAITAGGFQWVAGFDWRGVEETAGYRARGERQDKEGAMLMLIHGALW
jgi:hypothetical protein